MSKKNDLSQYRKKRKLDQTPEPEGKQKKTSPKPIFVIQLHDASTRHYDFRIEVNGVLKSWSVPKGPSTNPRDKRLAIQTDDHPLDYAEFEGVIPEGHYGAGTVMIWDKGTYRNLKTGDDENQSMSMEESLKQGHAAIWLDGQKIKGGYALIRTKKSGENQWLLIKMDDQEADARRRPVSTQTKSAASGRTLKEIAEQENN